MVLKYITKGGNRIHGPPYTKAEEAEFHRRAGPPVVISRRDRKAPKSPAPQQQASRQRPKGGRPPTHVIE